MELVSELQLGLAHVSGLEECTLLGRRTHKTIFYEPTYFSFWACWSGNCVFVWKDRSPGNVEATCSFADEFEVAKEHATQDGEKPNTFD
jgi:hypothetical protein